MDKKNCTSHDLLPPSQTSDDDEDRLVIDLGPTPPPISDLNMENFIEIPIIDDQNSTRHLILHPPDESIDPSKIDESLGRINDILMPIIKDEKVATTVSIMGQYIEYLSKRLVNVFDRLQRLEQIETMYKDMKDKEMENGIKPPKQPRTKTVREKALPPFKVRHLKEKNKNIFGVLEIEGENINECDNMETNSTEKDQYPPPPPVQSSSNKRKITEEHSDDEKPDDGNDPKQPKIDDFIKPRKNIKIPPIVIMDQEFNWKNFNEEMTKLNIKDFDGKCNADRIIIKPKNEDTYRFITKHLEGKVKSYTYLLPDQKKLKVVVRGLPRTTEVDDIAKALKEEWDLTPESIVQLTKRQEGERVPIPLFLLILTKNNTNKEIYNVGHLLNMSINIENYRGRGKGPIQCHRCQRYMHTQSGCRLEPRCVKCAGPHLTKDCTIQKTESPKCVNCDGNHVASYKKCPNYMNIIDKMSKQNNNKKQYRNPVYVNSTYAEAVRNENTKNTLEKIDSKLVAADEKTDRLDKLISMSSLLLTQMNAQYNQFEKQQQQLRDSQAMLNEKHRQILETYNKNNGP